MNTYLLTWNPEKWPWNDLAEIAQRIRRIGYYSARWSSGRNKSIVKGDRVFLVKQGSEDARGIFASGWVTSKEVQSDLHWDDTKSAKGLLALYAQVRFDALLDPYHESILSREEYKTGILKRLNWDSRASGVIVKEEVAVRLEIEWTRLLSTKGIVEQHSALMTQILPEEILDSKRYYEGAKKQIVVNSYERNSDARKKCLEYYGLSCYVCGFNFEKAYGDLGVGFIHVHHLKPLSEINEKYELDPVKDLRPVCPNCHAMIHREVGVSRSIEEVRKIWEDELNK